MNTEHLDRLTLARSENLRMKAALELARQRAADSEIARQDAEQRHANTVADAMLAGDKTPSKPASLSAIQSADDSADAALAIIEARAKSAQGELDGAAYRLVEDAITDLAQRRAIASRQALRDLIAPITALVASIGLNGARYAAAELVSRPFMDSSGDEITKLAELVPEVGQIRAMFDIKAGEEHTVPSPADIGALVDEVRK